MKKSIAVTIDESIMDKIKDLALIENRNISNLVETILRDYLENNKED